MNFNQWSATEYYNSFSGFAQINSSSMSDDYSIIGNRSVYLIHGESHWWVDVLMPENNIMTDTQYTISADVYIKSGTACLRLINNSTVVQEVYCSSSGLVQLSLSGSITDEINDPRIRFMNYNDGSMYIDNIKLTTP